MEAVPTRLTHLSYSDASSPLLLFRHRRRRLVSRGGPLPPLRQATARFLRRPLARRMMLSSPSFLVRENAAEQLEHRQNDWSYSTPVVALDVFLNLVLVGVALCAVVLGYVGDDDVELIRVWVIGYGLGCMVHVACVAVECKERLRGRGRADVDGEDDSEEDDGGIQIRLSFSIEMRLVYRACCFSNALVDCVVSLLFNIHCLRGSRFVFFYLGQVASKILSNMGY